MRQRASHFQSLNLFQIGILAGLFFIQFSVFAQKADSCNCQLHGEVIDASDNQPIIGAVLILKGTSRGTISDKKGHYHFDKLCHGNQIIICRIVGYKEIIITVKLTHDDDFEHNFKLNEDNLHLDHVEIKASKIENLTQNKSVLENANIDQTRGQSLGDAIKQIAGVTTLQTGSSIVKPVIHGMHSNRILILNNGVRQEGQQWGSEHAPEIDPFTAKKITVLKGAAGVRYGSDAIAGVVMLESNALPDSNVFDGEFNAVYFSNGRQVVNAGRLEKGFMLPKNQGSIGLRLQGTFKRGGNVSTPRYSLANTGMFEANYSLSANYKKDNWLTEIYFSSFNTLLGVFSGSHIGNTTDLIAAINREKPQDIYSPRAFTYIIERPYQDVNHNLLKVVNSKKSTVGKFSLTLGHQYDYRREVDVLRGDRNLVQLFKLRSFSGEFIFEHQPIFRILTGSIGITSMLQENLTTGILKTPRSSTVLIPNFQNNTTGLFLIERMNFNKSEFEAGLRYDNRDLSVYRIPRGEQNIVNNQKNNQNITATIGHNYRPTTNWSFISNISSAWRAATVNELYSNGVHHGAASFEKGDENLLPEVALNASFTAIYDSKKLQTELHFYDNTINNYIFLSPTGRPVLSIRGAFPEFFYAQTKARFQGFDWNIKYQILKNIALTNKISYLKAQDLSNNQPLILIPANRIENAIRYESKRSFIGINHQFVAKQSRVPSKVIFKDIPVSEIVFNQFGGDYSPPPLAYHLWSATFGHDFLINEKQNLHLSISGSNLLNTNYRDYLNRFRYFSDEIGRNIVLRAKYSF